MSQAEQELAQLPAVSLPTAESFSTATPIPNYTPADALEIATAVAENRADVTPSPNPTIVPLEDREYRFALFEDGENFREIPGGVWYTSQLPAEEVILFYLDDLAYFRWDVEISEQGDEFADLQFWRFDERYQLSIWASAERELTVITVVETGPFAAGVDGVTSAVYEGRWPIIGDQLGIKDDGGGVYTADYPLPFVRAFYLRRMLDAGWQPQPAVRTAPALVELVFSRNDDQITFILRDDEAGTLVEWSGTP